MYRTIWSYYFITGLLSLTAGVPAMDDWASALIPAAGETACHLGAATKAEVMLCLAAGFNEMRALAGGGFDVLFGMHAGMAAAEWVRVADVAVIMAGSLAGAIALIWVWANAMTRLAALSLTGTYTLVRAVGAALEQRGYRA